MYDYKFDKIDFQSTQGQEEKLKHILIFLSMIYLHMKNPKPYLTDLKTFCYDLCAESNIRPSKTLRYFDKLEYNLHGSL